VKNWFLKVLLSHILDYLYCYLNLGLSSPWEKVFHARGFIVAVVGLYESNSVVTHRLKAPGSNPRACNVISWFFKICLIQRVPLRRGPRQRHEPPRGGHGSTRRLRGEAVQFDLSRLTLSLIPPGINPCTLHVISWLQAFD
jgi:hypothetical protein